MGGECALKGNITDSRANSQASQPRAADAAPAARQAQWLDSKTAKA